MPSALANAVQHQNTHRASNRRQKSVFLEEGVIKTIVLVVREQQAVASRHSSQNARVGVTRRETAYRLVILFAENGTGHVKQFTTTSDDLPQRFQQTLLLRGKFGDVRGSPEPFDIRVPSHDSRGG